MIWMAKFKIYIYLESFIGNFPVFSNIPIYSVNIFQSGLSNILWNLKILTLNTLKSQFVSLKFDVFEPLKLDLLP